jgi:hypothetical protein
LRRLSSVGVLLVALALLFGMPPSARRPSDPSDDPTRCEGTDPGFMTVIEVNGLLDDILVELHRHASIDEAERDRRALPDHPPRFARGGRVRRGASIDLARQHPRRRGAGRHLGRTVRISKRSAVLLNSLR